MASYEGLRKLTLSDKPVVIKFKCAGTNLRVPISQVPTFNELCFIVQRLFRSQLSTDLDNLVLRYEDEDGDLITIQDDADISYALSLSSLLKLTVNDKLTHPVFVPIEHLSTSLVGMNENQTVAAVTKALVDLQDRIGMALRTIQSQHPVVATTSSGHDSENPSIGKGGHVKLANGPTMDSHRTADSKPLVLSAESLDQLLEPRKSLLARQTSVSSQASSLQAAPSPSLTGRGSQQPVPNVSNQFQQQVHQQQHQPQPQQHVHQPTQPSVSSNPWPPQAAPLSNGMPPAVSSPLPSGGQPMQPLQQQQQQQYSQTFAQPQQQQQSYAQYTTAVAPQQQQIQQQQQQPLHTVPQSQMHQQGQLQSQQGPGQQAHAQVFAQSQPQPQQQPIQQQPPQQPQQPLQQQQQQQQQQTPYMQSAYAASPYNQQQQQYSSTPFMRSNSVYVPQQPPLNQGYAPRA